MYILYIEMNIVYKSKTYYIFTIFNKLYIIYILIIYLIFIIVIYIIVIIIIIYIYIYSKRKADIIVPAGQGIQTVALDMCVSRMREIINFYQ